IAKYLESFVVYKRQMGTILKCAAMSQDGVNGFLFDGQYTIVGMRIQVFEKRIDKAIRCKSGRGIDNTGFAVA
ncbi:MAG: hypothetical protein JXA21_20610, partial [Anaerolineae bacterium]|nr:hypothetical protein [Anaerolineae bacterium]